MSDFPEHERMSAVSDDSQVIGEFLDWLNEQGVVLAEWERSKPCSAQAGPAMVGVERKWQCRGGRMIGHPESNKPGEVGGTCTECAGTGRVHRVEPRLSPRAEGIQETLAAYFGINLSRLEAEKRAMLKALRSAS